MRALLISDHVEPVLYGPTLLARVGQVDLIISCGDLPFYYIEFIISTLNRPAYYVFGNHGREYQVHSGKGDDFHVQSAPFGATDLHGRSVNVGGLLLAGLEGSMRYNLSADKQYTDSEMWRNIFKLMPSLLYNRIRYGRWLDVLVTHSPPLGIHDQPDRAHIGFRAFLPFMRWFKPRYLLHGHIHLYRGNEVTRTAYHATTVVNVYPFKLLDL
jgi:Icc-related predicted phosphoesterase